VVIVFEGWDAGGKGGAIKRLTAPLDPRGYTVIPISAPKGADASHHYLWRFWRHLPKDGHFGIFDRSWYGRVTVERVEGFCTEEEWRRAYQEINEFEYSLHRHGAVLLKFWLEISPEEQLRRFQRRLRIPSKRVKITDEDWRNRAKWPRYLEAVSDMLRQTSTPYAPWTIVEAESKRYARVKVLSTTVAALEARLNE
jgi:polyphosphate kinase 2 (PPK2 family)